MYLYALHVLVIWVTMMIETGDLIADGLDEAIIGVAIFKSGLRKVIYSVEQCVEVMMQSGMSHDEAFEYLEYNTFNSYQGKKTPLFLYEDEVKL